MRPPFDPLGSVQQPLIFKIVFVGAQNVFEILQPRYNVLDNNQNSRNSGNQPRVIYPTAVEMRFYPIIKVFPEKTFPTTGVQNTFATTDKFSKNFTYNRWALN